jgi:hypothetical protein
MRLPVKLRAMLLGDVFGSRLAMRAEGGLTYTCKTILRILAGAAVLTSIDSDFRSNAWKVPVFEP